MHKLLLVDDDPAFCEVLSQALDRRGYAVYVAHNTAEGLAAASRCQPTTLSSTCGCLGDPGLNW
jgi:two-component system, response regulator RegA